MVDRKTNLSINAAREILALVWGPGYYAARQRRANSRNQTTNRYRTLRLCVRERDVTFNHAATPVRRKQDEEM